MRIREEVLETELKHLEYELDQTHSEETEEQLSTKLNIVKSKLEEISEIQNQRSNVKVSIKVA